jgi:hypothetical protein
MPVIAFGFAWTAILGLVVFGLWNVLMPSILGLHAITYWQALGLLALSRVLFGNWHQWRKARFVRGWNDLTPEERLRFRNAMDPHHAGDSGASDLPARF